jgi:hypothetical protein
VAARDETYTSRSVPSAFKTIQSQLADSVAGELESPTYLTQTPYGAPAEKRSCPESSHFPEPSCALLPMSAIITKESFGPDMTTIVVVGDVTCILLALRRAALVGMACSGTVSARNAFVLAAFVGASFIPCDPDFLSGGPSFSPGRACCGGRDGRCFCTFLSVRCRVTCFPDLLVFSDRIAYPMYFSMPEQFGLSVLEDQQCAAR